LSEIKLKGVSKKWCESHRSRKTSFGSEIGFIWVRGRRSSGTKGFVAWRSKQVGFKVWIYFKSCCRDWNFWGLRPTKCKKVSENL